MAQPQSGIEFTKGTGGAASTPAATAVSPQPQIDPAQAAGGVLTGNSIVSILSSCQNITRLSPDGQLYVENLKKAVQGQNLIVETAVLSTFEVIFVHSKNTKEAVCLVMDETFTRADNTPAIVRQSEIMAHAANRGFRSRGSIVVTPDEYKNIPKMAAYLSANLNDAIRKQYANLSVTSFFADNVRVLVNTDINAVMDFIRSRSPHEVPARADCGVLISVSYPTEGVKGLPNRDTEYVVRDLAAATAYTDIVECPKPGLMMQSGERGYVPLVTISDIVTDIPTPNILGMVIAIVTEALIFQSRWLAPYGFTKDSMNLGNLFINEKDGSPVVFTNPQEQERYMNQYFLYPRLAVNITEGRCRILGIDTIATPDQTTDSSGKMRNNMVIQGIRNFFAGCANINDPFASLGQHPNPASIVCNEFCGTIRSSTGQVVDSHFIDYLNLVKNCISPAKANSFLNKPIDVSHRMREIATHVKDARTLYFNRQVILDNTFVALVGAALKESRFSVKYLQEKPSLFDTSLASILASPSLDFRTNTFGGPGTSNMWSLSGSSSGFGTPIVSDYSNY